MSQQQLLNEVLDVFQRLEISYMITGSWASSMQGQPRSTHDLDLVVQLDHAVIETFHAAFPHPEFYLDRQSIEDALRDRSMFNLLDNRSGDKVDFWMLTDEPWDRSRFQRRITVPINGRDVFVSSPEDTIVAKLRWSEMSGGSQRQFQDALHVCEVNWDSLDRGYIEEWCKSLDIADSWQSVVAAARRPDDRNM